MAQLSVPSSSRSTQSLNSNKTPPPYEYSYDPSASGAKEDPAAHADEDAETLLSYFNAPPPTDRPLQPLPVPLCLPQATSGPTSLFVRAWSPELEYSGITMEEWLHFVDALNLAMAASPPLRVLNAAGMVIGIVPHWWFMVAGIAMQTIARAGMVIIAKSLSDRLLQRANKEFFAPRGLRVRICKTAAMRQLVGLTATGKKSSKLVAAGRTAETIALHLPIIGKVYNRIAPRAPLVNVDPHGSGSMTQRRMEPLEHYTLPLNFNVPPAAPPETIMQKAQGMSVRLEQWKERGSESKADRNRHLLAIAEGRENSLPPRPPSDSSSWMKQAWEFQQARRTEMEEWNARRKAAWGQQPKSLQTKVQIADRLEYNSTRDLLWAVVLNEEQDEAIQGRELLDDPSAVEQIPEAEWRDELREEAEDERDMRNGY